MGIDRLREHVERLDEEPKYRYSSLDVWRADTPDEINEASLYRVWQHYSGLKNARSWSLLTSWRSHLPGFSPEDEDGLLRENKRRFAELKQLLKKWKLGYFFVKGFGQEENPEDPGGEKIVVEEPSLFVVNISREQAEQVMRRYDQWGVLYAGPETQGKVWSLTQNGVDSVMTKFHPMHISKYYSVVKGKPFYFECLQPFSVMEGMALESLKKSHPRKILFS